MVSLIEKGVSAEQIALLVQEIKATPIKQQSNQFK